MQVIIGLFVTSVLFNFSFASDCGAVRWPFAKNINQMKNSSLEVMQRDHLYKYLYFEISNPSFKRIPGLAQKLFFYLKNSEQNEDRHNLLIALEWSADFDTPTPRILPLVEICSMEDKIRRDPSSVKKIKKIKGK